MAFIPMIYGGGIDISSLGDKLVYIGHGRSFTDSSYDYYLVYSMGIATSSSAYAQSQGTININLNSNCTVLKTIDCTGDKTNNEYTYLCIKLIKRNSGSLGISCGGQGDMMLIGITN